MFLDTSYWNRQLYPAEETTKEYFCFYVEQFISLAYDELKHGTQIEDSEFSFNFLAGD